MYHFSGSKVVAVVRQVLTWCLRLKIFLVSGLISCLCSTLNVLLLDYGQWTLLSDDVRDVSFTFLGQWKIFQTSMETPSRVIFELVCSQKRHVCVFYRRLFFNDVVLGKMLFSPEGIFLLQVATWQNWKQGWWAAPCPHYTLYIHDWQAPPSLTTVHLYTCRLEFDFSVCQTVFACFLMSLMNVDKPLTSLFSFNIGWTLLYTNHLSNTSQGEKVQIWLSPKIGCHTCTHTDAHAQS